MAGFIKLDVIAVRDKDSFLAFRSADIIETLLASFALDMSHLESRIECDSRSEIVPFDALLGLRKTNGYCCRD